MPAQAMTDIAVKPCSLPTIAATANKGRDNTNQSNRAKITFRFGGWLEVEIIAPNTGNKPRALAVGLID